MAKPRPLSLFYLSDAACGGWVTALAHAREALLRTGCVARVYRIGAKNELKSRMWGELFPYENVSLQTAEQLCHATRGFVMATARGRWSDAGSLLQQGATLVFHDPTELHPESRPVLPLANRVVVFRRSNLALLSEFLPNVTYVPMPYVPGFAQSRGHPAARQFKAVAYSRLDFDKNTDVILRANAALPDPLRVRIFGSENRMYTHHKLDGAFPGWRSQYGGPFPRTLGAGEHLAGLATYAVDMSTIAGDGGGTQYTTLEAWAACSVPIVHERWLAVRESELVDEHNCVAAGSADTLVDVLRRPLPPERHRALLVAGQHALAGHAPEAFTAALLA